MCRCGCGGAAGGPARCTPSRWPETRSGEIGRRRGHRGKQDRGNLSGQGRGGPAAASSRMSAPIDLGPAVRRMIGLIEATPDGALGRPTPCAAFTVGDLLDHVAGSVAAFRAAAAKTPLPGGPSGDAANLGADWRTRISRDVRALADAWRDPDAWTG